MTVPQQRLLKTAIPGPRSQELHARKTSAVASGVGTTLPVYVAEAGGGIVVDVDGNQLIDFGSGIAVTTVGNAAPRVVSAVQEQVGDVHAHLLHDHAVRGLRRGRREAERAHAGHLREAVGAVQLRRRGGGERGQDRAASHRPAGDRRVRPRLPRTYQPDDGADGEEHAVQAPLRPVRGRDLPGADGLPVPLADRSGELRRRGVRAVRVAGAHPGRRVEHRCGAGRADPGRGRLRRPGAGVPGEGGRVVPRPTASCSSPTRSSPGSAAPATGSPASTRASCPTSSPRRRASPAACRWPR